MDMKVSWKVSTLLTCVHHTPHRRVQARLRTPNRHRAHQDGGSRTHEVRCVQRSDLITSVRRRRTVGIRENETVHESVSTTTLHRRGSTPTAHRARPRCADASERCHLPDAEIRSDNKSVPADAGHGRLSSGLDSLTRARATVAW